jgi:cell wall-associated NlpC family hydrolase
MRRSATLFVGVLVAIAVIQVPHAAPAGAGPDWVRPAINYLDDHGYIEKEGFRANRPMSRKRFKFIMRKTFGPGHYRRSEGKVRAGEVSAALVRALGAGAAARALGSARSPDGWSPNTSGRFGTEVVGRELGLRHDRPTSEDRFEASAAEVMRQADIAWALWKAKTDPDTYAVDVLRNFELADYDLKRRKVVQYAISLVGTPYVWGGEWQFRTPDGYPYGAQAHGGFDCSGFVWYVLHSKTDSYRPVDRPYRGWPLAQRASADMAAAAKRRLRYGKLRPGDVVFFAPDGRESKASAVYHAGIYLGRGWMIHSSGSRAGLSIGDISRGSWWHDQIAWGRRIIRS